MKDEFISLMQHLCSCPGISGQEQRIVKSVVDALVPYCDDIRVDNMGNVSAVFKGSGCAPSLMLVAHTDQVGAIVSEITDAGLIMFKTVGCVDSASLSATPVLVENCPGAISAPPAHMAAKDGPAPLYIDVGAECRQDVLDMGINIGSQITFTTPFTPLGKTRLLSHSIDDRVGCAILLSLAKHLSDNRPEGDVILGFSVREETTMAGAFMLVNSCKPDWVIAIDTVPMKMSPNGNSIIDLGRGPVFQLAEGVISSFSGNFVHPGVKSALIKAANDAGVHYQLCAQYGDWTTDGNTINRANCGTPSGYLSIPRRNAHSAAEIMDVRDALDGIKILQALIRDMSGINLSFI